MNRFNKNPNRTALLTTVLTLFFAVSVMADVHQEDFENATLPDNRGDVIHWTGPTGTSIVSDSDAKSGQHVLRFSYTGNREWSEQRFSLTEAFPDLWVRYWLRVPINFKHGSGNPTNHKLLAIWMDDYSAHGAGPTVVWEFWKNQDANDHGSNLAVHYSPGNYQGANSHKQHTPFIDYPSDQGRWMEIVAHVKAASAAGAEDGVIELWRRWENESDFTKFHELTDADIAPPNNPDGWKAGYLMGWANAAYSEDTEWLIDDFTISDSSLLDSTGGSGPVISVDSTYSGYSKSVIYDEVIDAEGGTSTTWASAESDTEPHWVELAFNEATQLDAATIHWAYNHDLDQYMASQEVQVQMWDGSSYQTVATMDPYANDTETTVTFVPVTTTKLRFYQPAGQGPANYDRVMWLTEIDYGLISSPVTVDSTYSGYSTDPINDGVIDATGGTSTTWASEESTTEPHWVKLELYEATDVDSATIHWAYNDVQDQYMASQEVQVQMWDGSSYQTVATMNPGANDTETTVTFAPITTTKLRFYQPANQGPASYSRVMWLTEIDFGLTQSPQVSFTTEPSNGFEAGVAIGFTDTSTGNGTLTVWQWDFGDGDTSTNQHPIHTYAEAGSYEVTLEVTDDANLMGETSRVLDVGGIVVDSTYSGYSDSVINDGVIDPTGGTSTTWASGESDTDPHWVEIHFGEELNVDSTTIHWAYNDYQGQYMASQEVQVQVWDGSSYQTVATMNPGSNDTETTITFDPVATTSLRFYQPVGQGPASYDRVMWLTEIDYSLSPDEEASSGGALTLSGFTGAGSKATPEPVLHHNFGDYAVGTTLTSLGYKGSSAPAVANDHSYGGSQSAKHVYQTGSQFPKVWRETPSLNRKVYLGVHMRWHAPMAGDIGIFKGVRGGAAASSSDLYSGSPIFYETIRSGNGSTQTSADKGIRTDGGSSTYVVNQTLVEPINANQWHFEEFLFDMGTLGNADAFMKQWVNGVLNTSVTSVDALPSGSTKKIDGIMTMFDGLDGSDTGLEIWQQDFYIDSTPQRVVLTDNVDYTASSDFILQPVVSWTDDEVEITKTLGGVFTEGQTGYFHLFDADGYEVVVISQTL